MNDQTRWYRQGLFAQVDALEVARVALEAGSDRAAESIRRVAQTLRRAAFAPHFPRLVECASAVEDASPDALADALTTLIAALREEASVAEGSRVEILVIESDPLVAQLIRATLATQNREVVVAEAGLDAEGILAESDISLILLDLDLPDTDGRALLLRLRHRAHTAALPIVVLSAEGDPGVRTEMLALGADDLLEKPLVPELLSACVSARMLRVAEVSMNGRYDSLTGLRNRAAFTEAFEHELSVSVRHDLPLSVVVLGIDRFKRVNDLYGNVVGDEVLQKVTRWITKTLRGADVIGRWGGDEFALIFPGTDLPGAVNALRKVQAILQEHPVIVDGVIKVRVTCSAGVVLARGDQTVAQLMTAAERQLHLAKVSGRNRIVTPDDDVAPETRKILLGEDDGVTAKLITHRLRREGFEVMGYAHGSELLREAEGIQAHLVILEGRLPGVDGFELLRHLRRMPSYASIPILMITTAGRERDAVRAFDLGASDHLTKPFSAAELIARVHRLLREAEGMAVR